MPAVSQALTTAGINGKKAQLLGTGLWNDARVLKLPALQGAWFSAPENGGFNAFATRYRAKYGVDPPRIATLSYDAVSLAAALAHTQGSQRYSDNVLTNRSGFNGADGVFRFQPDGTNERGLSVLEIDRGRRRRSARRRTPSPARPPPSEDAVKTIFLPGAGGSAELGGLWLSGFRLIRRNSVSHGPVWGTSRPRKMCAASTILFRWFSTALDEASNIVAQSMGGLVAVRSALKAPVRISAPSSDRDFRRRAGRRPRRLELAAGLPESVSGGREMDHGNPTGPVERNSVDQGPRAFNLGR